MVSDVILVVIFCFQAEDGIRDLVRSRGLGDVYKRQLKTGPKPVYFVFHGGSGSPQHQIREAIGYGAIKMNIDTDLQLSLIHI